MRLQHFLLEYERESSKRREKLGLRAPTLRRPLVVSRSLPGNNKLLDEERGDSPSRRKKRSTRKKQQQQHAQEQAQLQASLAHLQEQRVSAEHEHELLIQELARATDAERREVETQAASLVPNNDTGRRAWSAGASSDRRGPKVVDAEEQGRPDKHRAVALREVRLSAQGNMEHVSTVIKLAAELDCLQSGVGGSSGHIARALGSPGPLNGHNRVQPWEQNPHKVITLADQEALLVEPKVIYLPKWDRHHVAAKLLSLNPSEKDKKPPHDPLFQQEIAHFRVSGLSPKMEYEEALLLNRNREKGLSAVVLNRGPNGSRQQGQNKRPSTAPLARSINSSGSIGREFDASGNEGEDGVYDSAGPGIGNSADVMREIVEQAEEMQESSTRQRADGSEAIEGAWFLLVKELRTSARCLNYKDLVEITAYREPPEFLVNFIGFICILLGLTPSWHAAKRSLFKELMPLQTFLREVEPLTIPLRRVKKALRHRESKMPNMSPEVLRDVCRSDCLEKLARWILAFESAGKIMLKVEKSRIAKRQKMAPELQAKREDRERHFASLDTGDFDQIRSLRRSEYGFGEEVAAINAMLAGADAVRPTSASASKQLQKSSSSSNNIDYTQQGEEQVVSDAIIAARKKYLNKQKVVIAPSSVKGKHPNQLMPASQNSNSNGKSSSRPSSSHGSSKKSKKRGTSPSDMQQDSDDDFYLENGKEAQQQRISTANCDALAFFDGIATEDDINNNVWQLVSQVPGGKKMAEAALKGYNNKPTSTSQDVHWEEFKKSPLRAPLTHEGKVGVSLPSSSSPSPQKPNTVLIKSALKSTSSSSNSNSNSATSFSPSSPNTNAKSSSGDEQQLQLTPKTASPSRLASSPPSSRRSEGGKEEEAAETEEEAYGDDDFDAFEASPDGKAVHFALPLAADKEEEEEAKTKAANEQEKASDEQMQGQEEKQEQQQDEKQEEERLQQSDIDVEQQEQQKIDAMPSSSNSTTRSNENKFNIIPSDDDLFDF